MESKSGANDVELLRRWAPGVPRNQSFGKRIFEEQESRKSVDTLQRGPHTAELLFRTALAGNQISIYGAEAYWCNDQYGQATKLRAAHGSEDVPPDLASYLTKLTIHTFWAQGDLAQRRDEEIANIPEAARLATLREDAGFVKTVSVCQFFLTSSELKLSMFGDSIVCREHTHPR